MNPQITEDFDVMEVRRFNQINSYTTKKIEAAKKPLSFTQLMNFACEAVGIEVDVFQQKTRRRECVYARTLVSVYMQAHTQFSLRTIGELTGGRDHASALHDKKRYSDLQYSRNTEWMTIESKFVDKLHSAGRHFINHMPIQN